MVPAPFSRNGQPSALRHSTQHRPHGSQPSDSTALDLTNPTNHTNPTTTGLLTPPDSPNPTHHICIIGVGFVGESLTREFGTHFPTTGYDISPTRLATLAPHFTPSTYPNVTLTNDPTTLSRGSHFLIAVPTLLRQDRSVNLDYVHAALKTVLAHARPGSAIVIESSVSVGTTRALLGPYKHIFHCGMSPERVDPGRTTPSAAQIPKVVSALSPAALKAILDVYGRVFETVVPVSKPEVAEMTKLFENCYRMVNIAYVNEVADACRGHGIDPLEMVRAAATKPYGFEAFWPGLGVGGHCIPVNPFYLLANNKNLPVLERATKLMWNRPKKLAKKFHRRCLAEGAQGRRDVSVLPRVLVVGVGFKPGQAVLSCSPGLAFAQALHDVGCARLAFYDPLVPQSDVPWMEKLEHPNWSASYIDAEFDGIAICCQQQGVDLNVVEKLHKTFVRSFS